jgi:hypothetical protein
MAPRLLIKTLLYQLGVKIVGQKYFAHEIKTIPKLFRRLKVLFFSRPFDVFPFYLTKINNNRQPKLNNSDLIYPNQTLTNQTLTNST